MIRIHLTPNISKPDTNGLHYTKDIPLSLQSVAHKLICRAQHVQAIQKPVFPSEDEALKNHNDFLLSTFRAQPVAPWFYLAAFLLTLSLLRVNLYFGICI